MIASSKIAAAGSLALGMLFAGMTPSNAILFTGSGTLAGNSVSASVEFQKSGDLLTIILTNTSVANLLESPGSTLSGLSFKIGGGDPLLTPVSAISPSAIFQSGFCDVNACGGTNVNIGGEWGYQNNYGPAPGVEVVASSGYIDTGLAHNLGNFNGLNLEDPKSLDGIEFAILSSSHGALNGGLAQAMIMDSATFKLNGFLGFSLTDLSDVTFIYGTSAGEGSTNARCVQDCGGGGPPPPVPEPASLLLLGTGLLGGALIRRRRKRA